MNDGPYLEVAIQQVIVYRCRVPVGDAAELDNDEYLCGLIGAHEGTAEYHEREIVDVQPRQIPGWRR